jgi:anti-sigma-K factor RskA
MMRASFVKRDEPRLEDRLSELDAQLRTFEASLRAHQQSHSRVRGLELELADVVERGAAVVRELTAIRDEIREVAKRAAHEAATPAEDHLKAFEERGRRLLDAYAEAVRAAQQAVARAEARIDAFDERVARALAQTATEIREAAELIRHAPTGETGASSGSSWLVPATAAAVLLILGVAGYFSLRGSLRDVSTRAETAERQAADVKRDADQRMASIEKKTQQVNEDVVQRATKAELMASILAAPDTRRMSMRGYGKALDASGEAIWSPSRGLVITGSPLPPLSDRETYQVWFVSAKGSISLGVLTADRSGRLEGAFDVPSGLRSPRGFMITRESAGGAERPSNAVVLAT